MSGSPLFEFSLDAGLSAATVGANPRVEILSNRIELGLKPNRSALRIDQPSKPLK